MKFSIRVKLLKSLIAPLLFLHLAGAAVTYWVAWGPAQTAFDQSLADAAWALVPRLRELSDDVLLDLPREVEQMLRIDHFDAIYFVVRDDTGKTIAGDADFPPLILSDKLRDTNAYTDLFRGERIRTVSLRTTIGKKPVFIGVGETLQKRQHIQSVIVVSLLLVEGLLTVVAIVLVWTAVTNGLRPLEEMKSDLNRRSRDDLSQIRDDNVALELGPLIGALNGLLTKAQQGSIARQDFLANVAHQLRTPLAELKMQLEWLQQRQAPEAETARCARLMMSSTERMIRQTNQFLALARAESSQFEKARFDAVRLDKLVEDSIQYFVGQADRKQIDLGFDLQPVHVLGDRFLLRDMIDNLIDNAIRYSSEKGLVTVRCRRDGSHGVFTVEDSGPGIAEAEKELIFNRFYRGSTTLSGSGLGLAIVLAIVQDHGAEIMLTSGEHNKGTVFSVRFPDAAIA